jgi:hypothetical protein
MSAISPGSDVNDYVPVNDVSTRTSVRPSLAECIMSRKFPGTAVAKAWRGFVLASMLGALASPALASDDSLPPRSEWRASSSSAETPAMASPLGIDGDPKTRWGGGFSPGHWYQVDLGRPASVGGVMLRWDTGYARAYSLQVSSDGQQWRTAFETRDGLGGVEYDFFPIVTTRYLRIAAPSRTADWGVSIFEFEPIAGSDAPKISGLNGAGDTSSLWAGQQSATRKSPARDDFTVALPRALELAGLEIFWDGAPAAVKLEARDAAGNWTLLSEDRGRIGAMSHLAATAPATASALRVTTQPAGDAAPKIARLRVLGPNRVMTPFKRYEIAASREHAELFPSSLHARQVYWTAVGIPAGRQKSVFDEYGNLEAFKGAPLVQPIWRGADGKTAAAFDATLTHRLRHGWMPMPTVEWSPAPGLTLVSEAIAIERDGAPVTLLRHRLTNRGSTKIEGSLALATRPMQISPPWQNGGPSPIKDIAIERNGEDVALRVNGRVLLHALTKPDAAGAAAFGAFGEGEVTRHAAEGTVPEAESAKDDAGLGAALLRFDVSLDPGEHEDIVLAFALGDARLDPEKGSLPASPAIDRAQLLGASRDAGKSFDTLAAEVEKQWDARLGRIGFSLPDESLVNMLRAQAAYMLINQSGPAMQPGPRNYNRSFIRDGSATAAALLRMGMASSARDYLRWYAQHAVHENGLVSPILNDDGSVNDGFGSDLEHDSQGQFIFLVAEIARLDGGAETVREFAPQVKLAMRFLQELRERTMVPGYLADRPAPERFHGILAPSISHEGYSTPTHSYWDDYWGLKGWHDGAWLAEQWGDAETAKWAREQHDQLRSSVAASIRATMKWKGRDDMIPASADLGDGDPTSVSIGLDPAGQQDILPADALSKTFAKYLDDVRARDKPDPLYAYTPYEMRNVLTYVHLNRPREADELLTNLLRHRRPAEWQVLAEVVYSDLRHAIYLGDMPHTWIGAEYVRAIIGMLMYEADDHLRLLPGAPPSWLAGKGLSVDKLPTAYGTLTISARQQDGVLEVKLGEGLRAGTPIHVSWPSRIRPKRVTVDGEVVDDFTDDGVRLERSFGVLTAHW